MVVIPYGSDVADDRGSHDIRPELRYCPIHLYCFLMRRADSLYFRPDGKAIGNVFRKTALMSSIPPVSVLMTVYNAEPFLDEAIKSILGQSFGDFEFIIIDNASTDGSREMLASCSDSRLRVFHNTENIGPPRALNRGLQMAKGEYVARMDADDVALPDRLVKQFDFMARNPDCAAAGTQIRLFDHNGKKIYVPWMPVTQDEIRWKLMFTSPLAHSSVMMRKDCVLEVDGYDERFRYAPDYDLWSRLILQGHRLANLLDFLALIRIHGIADGVTALQADLIDEVARISARNINECLNFRVAPDEARKMVLLVNYHRCPAEDVSAALKMLGRIAWACAAMMGRQVEAYYGRTLVRLAMSPGEISPLERIRLFAKGLRLVVCGTDPSERYRFLKDWVLTGRFIGAIRIAWWRSALRSSRNG